MKKKISLLLCALMMILSLAGCSGKGDEGSTINEAELQNMTEFIIGNFSQMSDEELDQFKNLTDYQLDYTLMQSGLKVAGDDFIAMINSWEAAEKECGEYLSHGDYEVEVKTKDVVVSTLAQYEDREATIAFSFKHDMTMKSMDVSAIYSTGEILTKAGLNTLLGMGTVFAVLIFLAFLISLMKYIPMLQEMFNKKNKTAAVESAPAIVEETAVVEETDDLELIAVITAAIAAQEGTSTDGFVVRSIRRRPSNHWN